MVQFLCACEPSGQAENTANAKIIRMKHQIGLEGVSFNLHHFIFKKDPLIAERPEIRLSSIHRDL